MPLAMSQEHGHNLQTVQMLLKKNQVRVFFPAGNRAATKNSYFQHFFPSFINLELFSGCRFIKCQKIIENAALSVLKPNSSKFPSLYMAINHPTLEAGASA